MTPQPPQQQTPPQISPVGGGAEVVRDSDKANLVLSYLGFLCLIPLMTVKDSPFVTWHAKQGLTLCGFGLVTFFLLPLGLGFLNCLIWPAMLVVAAMSVIKSFEGVRWRIPLVADLSEKF